MSDAPLHGQGARQERMAAQTVCARLRSLRTPRTWMKEKVAAPVDTLPDSCDVSAAVWLSRAAPIWNASPPAVP